MRSFLFNIFFYLFTTLAAIVAIPLLILPGNRLLWGHLGIYTKSIRAGLKLLNGSSLEVHGKEHLPTDRPYIIAAKHSSEGDTILLMSSIGPYRAITWQGLTKIPLVGRILKKIDAIFVESCGAGQTDKPRLNELAHEAKKDNQPLVIYPEGRLVRLDENDPLKKGVFYLYKELNIPVVTMASNLGNLWQARDLGKAAGTATFEFHEPIEPGLEKDAFMAVLEEQIVDRSKELIDDQKARGEGLS